MTSRVVYTVCNGGKERSRILASILEKELTENDVGGLEVKARGSYGLGNDDKGVETKYGWTPPEGFVNLMKKKGIKLHTYESQMLTKNEIAHADVVVAVDPTIAKRIKDAYPEYSTKVVTALEAIGEGNSPFYDYLGHSIPDAWGGHLSKNVRDILHSKQEHPEKISRLTTILGGELNEEEKSYIQNYDSTSLDNDPTDIKRIPKRLRDYMGKPIESDEAYLEEGEHLKKVAKHLIKRLVA